MPKRLLQLLTFPVHRQYVIRNSLYTLFVCEVSRQGVMRSLRSVIQLSLGCVNSALCILFVLASPVQLFSEGISGPLQPSSSFVRGLGQRLCATLAIQFHRHTSCEVMGPLRIIHHPALQLPVVTPRVIAVGSEHVTVPTPAGIRAIRIECPDLPGINLGRGRQGSAARLAWRYPCRSQSSSFHHHLLLRVHSCTGAHPFHHQACRSGGFRSHQGHHSPLRRNHPVDLAIRPSAVWTS